MAEVANDEKENENIERSENNESSSSQKRSKHSKKHKHKHSKKHKHKHKKRKHKKKSSSRSPSRSSSCSRSRSVQSCHDSDNDFKFEASLRMNSEDPSSFKLTKSVSRSRSSSPSSKKIPDNATKLDAEAEFKSSPCLSVGDLHSRKRSRGKSKSPPFYTEDDLAVREKILARGSSTSPPICTEDSLELKPQEPYESKFKSTFYPQNETKNEGSSELKNGVLLEPIASSTLENNSTMNIESTPTNTETPTSISMKSESKKSRSKSPKTTNIDTKSKSSSRSASPKQSKAKRSYSRSRSRSPRKKHGKKSLSRSRGRSKSSISSSRSRSRSPKKSSRQNRSRDHQSRSPLKRRRSRRTPSPRRRYRNSSYNRRSPKRGRSYRRSPSPRRSYSRRSRSRSSRGRYGRKHSRPASPRRGRSRSPRSKKYSRTSYSASRSRSRSHSRRRRSNTRSRSKSRDRSKTTRSRSNSANKDTDKKNTVTDLASSSTTTNLATAKDLVGKAPTVTNPSNKRSLAELTEFCKKLTEARGISELVENKAADDDEQKVVENTTVSPISHPFLVAPKKDITIPQVIFPVKPILPPINIIDSSKPLTEQFPVSCGTKHHEKEMEVPTTEEVAVNVDGNVNAQPVFQQPQIQEKLDVSGLIVKRLDAQRRLQINPSDIDAMLALQEIEMKLNNWCQSNVKPGQYTGQLVKQMMPKEKANAGYQAWAKKDMFQNLNPVSGGIGMKLLQKMGWQPGQVLGKRGEGMAEPIALTVKVDRKGLSSDAEKPVGKRSNAGKPITMDMQGKHPISLLQEYCARRKWQVPDFTLIFDEGPPHSKQFLFKVAVNGYEYQHPIVSGNKKQAKAQAAMAALKGLGLVPEDAVF